MRRLTVGFVVGGLAVALLAAPAAAQGRQYIGVGFGGAIPTGEYGDATKLGWVAHLYGGFTTSGGIFGGRLDGSVIQNKIEGGSGSVRHIGGTANLVLTPGHRPADFHPYFLAGVGLYNSKQTGGGGSSETSFAWSAGAGVQIHLGHRTDFFVEGRWLRIQSDAPQGIIPVSIGVRWGGV